jgi:hypothetical protein
MHTKKLSSTTCIKKHSVALACPLLPCAIQIRFLFMAEVYWDLEWTLQQQGFDYAYDKRL